VFNVVDKARIPVLPALTRAIKNFKFKEAFISTLKANADVVISLTTWFREVLIVNGLPENKIIYLPQATPVYLSIGTVPVEARKGHVYIGRIHEEKGIGLFLNASRQLKITSPDSFIDVYGPLPSGNKFAAHFLDAIKSLDNIRYKNVLDPSAVLSTISRYKSVLLPSYVAEMAPLIIMEANKLKIPAIVSDVPGSAELVNQYHCGLVFDYGSADDLVAKILAVESGKLSFEFDQPFENNFDHIARKHIDIYRQFAV
jgi:hypothetical protein